MRRFDLAPWERFIARTHRGGPLVPIVTVWTDDVTRRMYGQSPEHHELIWINPMLAPVRVRDGSDTPGMDPAVARAICHRSAPRLEERTDEDREVADNLAALPVPEVRARPCSLEEMPEVVKRLGRKAFAAGFSQTVSYARGPRVNSKWQVLDITDHYLLRANHRDGRRFVAWWLTKTSGERAKTPGIVTLAFEGAYAMVDGVWSACNSTQLGLYISDGSLMKEVQHA